MKSRRDWQPQLFEQLPPKPRAKKRVLMHVIDAGGDSVEMVRFKCRTCGHDSGWQEMTMGLTQAKRGVPCPVCNGL